MAYTAMGDYGGPYDEVSDSPEVDRKTTSPQDTADNKSKSESTFKDTQEIKIGSNVLNGFRSVTYNFTLAGLPTNYLDDPDAYRKGELDLVILKSGGKGSAVVSNAVSLEEVRKANIPVEDPRDARARNSNETAIQQKQGLISDFNKFSPGRFDLFIENVEIDTLMTFTENSNTTLPTKIKFDVIEPYSINGFIETLHVTAVAAGYTSYINASYILKLEFWGYPDDDLTEFKSPIKIPNTERYFVIGFTNLEVEITERGTKYACSAVPYNERAFGQPSVIKKPIKMSGITVKEILDNFIKELNEQVKQSDKDANATAKGNDSYEVVFRERKNGKWIDSPASEIAKSPLLELYEDNVLYKFANPSEVKSAYKPGEKPKTINPSSAVVNFQENSTVQDIITAVIRDSTYVRNTLKDLAEASSMKKHIDKYGFVDYFLVSLEIKNKAEIDPNTKRPYQTFTYVITPYKVHITRIPTYGSVQLKEDDLKLFALREYNYIYTGNNIDIIGFKLNFNTLFFEAIPASLGDKNTPNSKDSSKPADDSKPKIKGVPEKEQKANTTHASPTVYTVPTPVQGTGGNAVPAQNSPYAQLARHMHEAIINSKASMITGNIDILGDPFYLVTGGVGNYNPKEVPGKYGVVGNDEADHLKGELNIAINFRNPIDINTFESGGMVYFDPNRVAFSGVYMITKAVSTFKNGDFRQTLEIIRKPGQILKEETNKKVINPEDLYKSEPNDDNKSAQSTSQALAPSQRLDSNNLYENFNRGFPSPGLPGQEDNFTDAPGGLGGADTSGLTRTYGLINKAGQLFSNAGVVGQSLPSELTSNIRLNQSGLSSIGQNVLSQAALINAAANILTGNKSAKNVAVSIAGNIIGSEISKIIPKYNVGSGIGEGKTVSISPAGIAQTALTANDIKFGNNISDVTNPAGLVNNVAGTVKQLGATALAAVNRLGSDANALVNNIGENVGKKLQSISDPNAAAARLGMDSAKISGLSSNLTSKLSSQIADISKNIPENVSLKQAVEAGLALDIIPISKFNNIPPTAPFVTAESFQKVTPVKAISDTLKNPLSNLRQNTNVVDASVAKDRINSARTQISNLTGQPPVIDSGVAGSVTTEFNSRSIKASPLTNLMNKES